MKMTQKKKMKMIQLKRKKKKTVKKKCKKKSIKDMTHPELYEVLYCPNECCDQCRKVIEIPAKIKIRNVNPGEPSTMTRRNEPAVIRTHKPKKDKDPIRFFLHELQLHIPWGCYNQPNLLEATEDEVVALYRQWEKHIEHDKMIIMPFQKDIEEARHWMYEVEQQQIEKQCAELAAAKEQENDDAEEDDMGEWDHQEVADMIDTDLVDDVEGDEGPRPEKTMISKIEMMPVEEMCKKARGMDKDQQMVLNIAMKYFKEIARARKRGTQYPKPTHLMVHGAAGVGKSHVIDTVCMWGEKILRQPGDTEDEPYILKTAWMGTAASNIGGQTLTSTFNLSYGNEHYSMSDKNRKIKKLQFKNLALLVIDEISTVGADVLYQLDAKLREMKEKPNELFGGVCLFIFGDLFQLAPVQAKQVYEKPSSPSYLMHYLTDPIWPHFTVINLETNHRQGKDKAWADTLNRIRKVQRGQLTSDDEKTLISRLRESDHLDLTSADVNIVTTREAAEKLNKAYFEKLPGEEVIIKAVHMRSSQKKFTPTINEKDGTIGSGSGTGFIDKLKVKINAKVIMVRNINTVDKLTNGQAGVIKDIIKDKNGGVSYIMVTFHIKSVGRQTREKYPNLKVKYPGATRVDRYELTYSLTKKAKGSTAKLIQFPLRLAHATTAHKSQGLTIHKPKTVSIDMELWITAAMGYVMLGRAQEKEQVFIKIPEKEKTKEKKEEKVLKSFYACPKVLKEDEKMNARSLNRNPPTWHKKKENQIKIAALNIYNLQTHMEDLRSDHGIKNADLILLSETWLSEEDEKNKNMKIETYKENFVSVGKGKGLASYRRDDIQLRGTVKTENYQIMKLTQSTDLHIIAAYRSSSSSINAFTEDILNLITEGVTTVIMGDMNICVRENPTNYLSESLERKGFSQMVKEPTHREGRVIDHIYVYLNENFDPPEMVSRAVFSNDYYNSAFRCEPQSTTLTTTLWPSSSPRRRPPPWT
jgi:exonuclease III